MKYKIHHETTYQYGEPVGVCQNEVHLTPRSVPFQTHAAHRITVQPPPESSSERVDYFGNPVSAFTISKAHRKLVVSAFTEFDVQPREVADVRAAEPWERIRATLANDHSPAGLDRYQFCFRSPHVPVTRELADYARPSFSAGRPIVEAALELTSRIFDDFTYDPKATTISTPLSEVLRKRRGVCQDLAHLQCGCLRALGLAARYVSGYLRTLPPEGKERLVGADASHAWASVYCGGHGWLDFDPTNGVMPSTDHVTIAWGRDYSDVCPVNGVFIGGGDHSMQVAVDVEPVG